MNDKEHLIGLFKRMKGKATIGEVADAVLDWHNTRDVFSKNLQNKEEINLDSPHFSGKAYKKELDQKRLTKDIFKVFHYMINEKPYTLREVSQGTNIPEASVSAHIRSFRKPEWGNHTVNRERKGESGTFTYQLVPNKESLTYEHYVSTVGGIVVE